MQFNNYYKTLECPLNAIQEEIKKAYHVLAKKNHPDLFPPENRHKQQLKMMQINEAYMGIIATLNDNEELSDNTRTSIHQQTSTQTHPPQNEVGQLKDPAYTYYKLGFDLYNDGQVTFHKRFSIKEDKRTINLFLGKKGLLNQAVAAIQKFEQAYHYFIQVIDNYPNSMWASDANSKLNEIEKLNSVYEKICKQITEIN